MQKVEQRKGDWHPLTEPHMTVSPPKADCWAVLIILPLTPSPSGAFWRGKGEAIKRAIFRTALLLILNCVACLWVLPVRHLLPPFHQSAVEPLKQVLQVISAIPLKVVLATISARTSTPLLLYSNYKSVWLSNPFIAVGFSQRFKN